MSETVLLDTPLTPAQIVQIAQGAKLALSAAAQERITTAHGIVRALVEKRIRGYGINTGVGALCDEIIAPEAQSQLSRNILFSHACGVGDPLPVEEVRAIMATQINNFALGKTGIAPETVDCLIALLNAGITPRVPARGSVGYLTHCAHIGLVVIGAGEADDNGERLSGQEALARIGHPPRKLGPKEGLILVNGTHCATGLSILASERLRELLDWADAAGAFSYEILARQDSTFSHAAEQFRQTPGVQETLKALQFYLDGMQPPERGQTSTQDPLSLRAIPQIHGAIRDELDQISEVLTQELRTLSDNPTLGGTRDAPEVYSQANAVGAAVALAADRLAILAAQIGNISERRLDRLVNPLVSGLPPFLGAETGLSSGFMIAQYTAVSLVNENRMLAAPTTLGGGITSALQEDILTHATPAALKAGATLANTTMILAMELLAGAQARDLTPRTCTAPQLKALYTAIRRRIPSFRDERPLASDIDVIQDFIKTHSIRKFTTLAETEECQNKAIQSESSRLNN